MRIHGARCTRLILALQRCEDPPMVLEKALLTSGPVTRPMLQFSPRPLLHCINELLNHSKQDRVAASLRNPNMKREIRLFRILLSRHKRRMFVENALYRAELML